MTKVPPDTAPEKPAERPTAFRSAGLSSRKPTRFDFRPDLATRSKMVQELDITALHGLRLIGEIRPSGSRDFVLEAQITAEVVQPCSITLAPVTTVINEAVRRRYIADWQMPTAEEIEMPEDDSEEPLPEVIDLYDVVTEAIALAMPAYPRAPGAELGEVQATPEGAAPIIDTDLKPFASLAALKAQLEGGKS